MNITPEQTESDQYVIAWKSRTGPTSGKGSARFSAWDAQAIARQANRDCPALFHWIERADQPTDGSL